MIWAGVLAASAACYALKLAGLSLPQRWLEDAGFKKIEVSVVAREEQQPHFQTILAGGVK